MAPVLNERALTVDDLLRLPKEVQSDLMTVMTLIYEQQFTGTIGLNCHLGVPKSITLPAPQIRLRDE